MNVKNYCLALLLGLLLLSLSCNTNHLAGTPANNKHSAGTPVLTGIPIDVELKQFLAQIVPYTGELPEEKRFLFNLNKLINEDLAEQDAKYKLAAAKLALRMALAINKTVDSIEVRRYAMPYHSEKHGIDVKGNFSWVLGGYVDPAQWGGWGEITMQLFVLKDGCVAGIGVDGMSGYCDGIFGNCCGSGGSHAPGINDAWFQHFVALGRQEDFPVSELKNIRSYTVGQ